MGALGGVLALDLTSGVGGAYAGKLMCDLGARVVVVESPGGHPMRSRPPPSGSMFEYLSGGKESALPASASEAVELLDGLCANADVLLTDGTSPWQALVPGAVLSSLVEVDLSPFGRSGPYAAWRGSDIAVWALGGYMALAGEKDEAPLMLHGCQAELHLAANAVFAALAALRERRSSGTGQRIEVSALESVLAAHMYLVSVWTANGRVLERVGDTLIRCRDGWVYFMMMPRPEIFVLIGRADLIEDDAAPGPGDLQRTRGLVVEWAAGQDAAEVAERGQELRIPVTPVLDIAAIRSDPQLASREWWEDDLPGQPYVLSATPSRRTGRAPHAGEQTVRLLAQARAAPAATVRSRSIVTEPPLTGIRVVEITSNWAGPVCGRHLSDLGAEVVKVEWAARPSTRLVMPGSPPDVGRRPYDRSLFFNEMNRNKRDVVLDLTTEPGRAVFKDLISRADVFIENYSARVMPNLGLGWTVLRDVNPRLVMVSMSGYGGTGPKRDWVAYGSNIETTCGLTSITGYADGRIYRSGLYYADPVGGILGAVAILAALDHRDRTGEGQWIDMSLNECGIAFCAEAILEHAATGVAPGPRGNRDPRYAPQGAYRCAGSDNWIALSVQSDREWSVLAPILGVDGLATLEDRRAAHDEIDAALTGWAAGRDQYEAAWELQRLGISAAPVLKNWQILADPHIHARGFYVPIDHPAVGVYPYPSWPWRFSRTRARVSRSAPLFGEHNREVLSELGFDERAIDKLYAENVIADAPERPA